ncbi:hypothetical protein D3C84_850510 [compost metagenome]
MLGFIRQAGDIRQQAMAAASVVLAPGWFDRGRTLEIVGQTIDLRRPEHRTERRHLAGWAAIFDHLADFVGLDPTQALGQQRRSGAADAIHPVALLAVLLVVLFGQRQVRFRHRGAVDSADPQQWGKPADSHEATLAILGWSGRAGCRRAGCSNT